MIAFIGRESLITKLISIQATTWPLMFSEKLSMWEFHVLYIIAGEVGSENESTYEYTNDPKNKAQLRK